MRKIIELVDQQMEWKICIMSCALAMNPLRPLAFVVSAESAITKVQGRDFLTLIFERLTMNARHVFARKFWLSIVGQQAIDFLLDVG